MDAVKNANALQKKALQQLTTFTDQEGKKQVADRASLAEMRRAKEAAQKIHDANIAQQNGPLQL